MAILIQLSILYYNRKYLSNLWCAYFFTKKNPKQNSVLSKHVTTLTLDNISTPFLSDVNRLKGSLLPSTYLITSQLLSRGQIAVGVLFYFRQ